MGWSYLVYRGGNYGVHGRTRVAMVSKSYLVTGYYLDNPDSDTNTYRFCEQEDYPKGMTEEDIFQSSYDRDTALQMIGQVSSEIGGFVITAVGEYEDELTLLDMIRPILLFDDADAGYETLVAQYAKQDNCGGEFIDFLLETGGFSKDIPHDVLFESVARFRQWDEETHKTHLWHIKDKIEHELNQIHPVMIDSEVNQDLADVIMELLLEMNALNPETVYLEDKK